MTRKQLEYKAWRVGKDLRLAVSAQGVSIWTLYNGIDMSRREARTLVKRISKALAAWDKAKR
jgi:hypothetical protein